jgi:hypothetical protein
VNESLDNKEENTYRSVKERKNMEKHKRVIGYLKTIANQKDNRLNQDTVCSYSLDSSSISPKGKGTEISISR